MALKCPVCGSAETQVGTNRFQCLQCGANNKFTAPQGKGRVENPDGAASYHGDDGTTYG